MTWWWPVLVLGVAYAICRFLLMLIPPNVPSIEVDASDVLDDDGIHTKENSYIYIPRKGGMTPTDEVQCYEPATMKYLGYFPALTPEEDFNQKNMFKPFARKNIKNLTTTWILAGSLYLILQG